MRTLIPSIQRQKGMAVILMLMLLSVLLIYVTANLRSLYALDRELKLTEHRQLQRLDALSATNAVIGNQ